MGSALEIMIRVSSGAGFHGNGKQSYLDPTLCKILGYIPEDLPGARPPFIYRPPEERDAVLEAFAKTASREAPAGGFELRFRQRNGERFDAIVLILPLVDGGGPCAPGWRVSDT